MGTDRLESQIQNCISQRKNLEAILNSVADGILAIDPYLRIVNLNLAAENILGLSRSAILGKSCSDVLERTGGSNECFFKTTVERGTMVKDAELLVLRPDRSVRKLNVTTHALLDEKGQAQGLVAILRDLTELDALRKAINEQVKFERLVGKNHRMREIYHLIEDMNKSDATILVLGESGTGKELVAEAIHRRSHRAAGPFVRVNCSVLSEGLLESELFGHVVGAFTGAVQDKTGRFEMADGGTIFLDEIGDISPVVQVKLLRVLQERTFERVGSTQTQESDVRVVAATHRDLKARMANGLFREDLYYRLYVVPIELPALRERKEDLPLLVNHFIEKFTHQTRKKIRSTRPDALNLMMDYDWPGNVRELENAIEHAFVKCHSDAIQISDLPLALVRDVRGDRLVVEDGPTLSEKDQMLSVLERTGWNRSRAARLLGMHRTTMWRKMKTHGIVVPSLV
ncbi:MAG: sigma 54-interacting transcriptional regulator [Candidatus Latescibacteria bacterium]|nr:sigma 54-interacting transcriptional regulator [Candidatus Latescibacterota bacterium]